MVRLMKSKFLISTKSSGLCFNIMRLIILTDIAKEYKRDLIFLTKPDHIPILKLFNTNCTFIPYIENHTDLFNNYKRQRSIHKVYDLKYTKFVLDTYLRNLFNDSAINNVKFVCGNRYDLNDSDHKFLLIDYNDGTHDAEILNSIKSKDSPMFLVISVLTLTKGEGIFFNWISTLTITPSRPIPPITALKIGLLLSITIILELDNKRSTDVT